MSAHNNHITSVNFLEGLLDQYGSTFAARAAPLDDCDGFVAENYQILKNEGVFSAMVPVAFGGRGTPYQDISAFLRHLAQSCSSTALAVSMHQHLIATMSVNTRLGRPGEQLLRKVALNEAVLVSTGAKDWLTSSGNAQKVSAGYHVTAAKPFASGAPAGDILVSSAIVAASGSEREIIHFALPMQSEGISLRGDWQAMGMRSTGSQTIALNNVFVPDEAVILKRPAVGFHPLYHVILSVGLPLIMSVYVGMAEEAKNIAMAFATKNATDPILPYLVGELETSLTMAQLALDDMVDQVDNLAFTPSQDLANKMLIRKSIISQNVQATCDKALEICGGAGFLRKNKLEKLLRDIKASQFHPLPEKRQQLFSGRLALGLDPV